MKLSAEPITVVPSYPFETARDRTEMSQSVIVRIEHNGIVGWGEAKGTADSCGGSDEAVCDVVTAVDPLLGNDPFLRFSPFPARECGSRCACQWAFEHRPT